jgi:hypothetical protein
LVSEIPAEDGKNDNLFLQCRKRKESSLLPAKSAGTGKAVKKVVLAEKTFFA